MSQNKKGLWLLTILLIYIAIAVAGFAIAYIIKIHFFAKPISGSTSSAAHVTINPTPMGWKTYSNNAYQLQFSYPPSDKLKTSSYGFGVSSLILQDAQGNTDFQFLLLPKSLAQMVGQDFDSYYAMPNKTTKTIKDPLSKDNTTEQFTKINNITVDGLPAVDYSSISSTAKPGTTAEIGTFIETGDNLVLISTDGDNKTTLAKLLSTFSYQ